MMRTLHGVMNRNTAYYTVCGGTCKSFGVGACSKVLHSRWIIVWDRMEEIKIAHSREQQWIPVMLFAALSEAL